MSTETLPNEKQSGKIKPFEAPDVAGVCQVIAWLMLGLGPLIIILAIANHQPLTPDPDAELIAGCALIVGSVFWFALARIVILLAKIAHKNGA